MASETEIAWMAGLMEGEGTFYIDHHRSRTNCQPRPNLSSSLTMTDQDVVQRAVTLFPNRRGKITYRANKRPEWKPSFQVCWYGQEAEAMMRAIRPHMGERRGAKIDECLATEGLSHR